MTYDAHPSTLESYVVLGSRADSRLLYFRVILRQSRVPPISPTIFGAKAPSAFPSRGGYRNKLRVTV
jgi:hypothetical protein